MSILSKRSLCGQCVCNSVNKREFIDERGLPCLKGIKEKFSNHIAIIGLPAHRKHGQAYFESSDFRYAVCKPSVSRINNIWSKKLQNNDVFRSLNLENWIFKIWPVFRKKFDTPLKRCFQFSRKFMLNPMIQ